MIMAWKLSDIRHFLLNSLKAMLKGEFLLRANVGRYFIHVLYTFFLFVVIIWISLKTEATMAKVEKNRTIINELEIEQSQMIFDLASAGRRSTVESNLVRLGSAVTEPGNPAYRIGK